MTEFFDKIEAALDELKAFIEKIMGLIEEFTAVAE